MANQDLTGKLLSGRYRVDRLIARGGMASVYLAEDERLERQVALKVIYPHLAEDEDFRSRFIREAKIAAKISHPNIVNIFDQGQDGELLYLTMEYVPSITLRDALDRFGAIDSRRALDLFAEILEGLAAAHAKGILHRDIKPENVFLADDGRIKLGDFGLARNVDAHTSTGGLIGTIAYLSPELITRGQADASSDVYAAGIMLFEMLTSRQPFQGQEAAHIAHQHTSSQMPAPSTIKPGIPALVDELVLWATARNPEHRPANALVLLGIVRRVQADLKAGRGATAKLDLPHLERTSAIDAQSTLDDGATRVLNPMDAAATQFMSDFGIDAQQGGDSNATQRIDPLDASELMSPLEKFAKRRRRRGKFLFFLIPTLALLSALAGWWLSDGPGGLAGIPDLKNRTVAEAIAALEPYEAKIVQTEVNSSTIAKGKIIKTDPAAGSLFFKGSELKLTVSKGPVLVAVPDLKGMSEAEATTALESLKFEVGTIQKSFNSTVEAGKISDYFASDGTAIPEGSSVDLEVSLGKVPNVIGETLESAKKLLTDAQLTISETTSDYSDKYPSGQVISLTPVQDPLRQGGEVDLVVSKGPATVIMPKVTGETLTAAKKLLEDLGLKVLISTDQLKANWGITLVKRQSAAAGSTVKIGETITISNR